MGLQGKNRKRLTENLKYLREPQWQSSNQMLLLLGRLMKSSRSSKRRVSRLWPRKIGNLQMRRPENSTRNWLVKTTMMVLSNSLQVVHHTYWSSQLLELASEDYYDGLIKFITSGPSHLLVLTTPGTGDTVVHDVRELLGPNNVEEAKEEAPDSM